MTTLSVIVPCYNEREGLPKLWEILEELARMIEPTFQLELVCINDGSTDGTGELLETFCRTNPRARVLHHPRNRGLGAALRTGFAEATGELIATIDSDCTYDPRELPSMLQLMTPDVDLVIASPYHPRGGVTNVPGYRLFLSHNLSRLYAWVTGSKLYTYTSLFRLYRASVLRAVRFESDGFLAMSQIVVGALANGARVAEYPTHLTVRQYGTSKAAVLRLIKDHARFLWQLVCTRSTDAPSLTMRRP